MSTDVERKTSRKGVILEDLVVDKKKFSNSILKENVIKM
jgi:hypothetical protein